MRYSVPVIQKTLPSAGCVTVGSSPCTGSRPSAPSFRAGELVRRFPCAIGREGFVVKGADGRHIGGFGVAEEGWLRAFLALPNGILGAYTQWRVFRGVGLGSI